MIIAVTGPHAVELRERENFRDFKVLVEPAGLSEQALAGALSGIARLTPEGDFAWVFQESLRRWQGTPQPEVWLQAFDKMVESVRRFGWIDDEEKSVRAHIERAPG